jgi:hypothetical protein
MGVLSGCEDTGGRYCPRRREAHIADRRISAEHESDQGGDRGRSGIAAGGAVGVALENGEHSCKDGKAETEHRAGADGAIGRLRQRGSEAADQVD